MTNNAWTLTKHLANSLNNGAGAVDRAIYGPVIEQPKPPKPVEKHNVLIDVGMGMIGLIILLVWVFTWQNRIDKVKERIMR
jgi:hypothetical protein